MTYTYNRIHDTSKPINIQELTVDVINYLKSVPANAKERLAIEALELWRSANDEVNRLYEPLKSAMRP